MREPGSRAVVLVTAALVALGLLSCITTDESSEEVPSGLASGLVKSRVTGGLSNASAMAIAPDGRIFVCQRGTNGNGSGGTATASVRVVKNGSLLAQPFVNITVDNSSFGCCNERGLVGIGIDPNFSTNQFIYVYYTVPGIRRSTGSAASPPTVTWPLAARRSLNIDSLINPNHNGGAHALRQRLESSTWRSAMTSTTATRRASAIVRARSCASTRTARSPPTTPRRSPASAAARPARPGHLGRGIPQPFTIAVSRRPDASSSTTSVKKSREEIDESHQGPQLRLVQSGRKLGRRQQQLHAADHRLRARRPRACSIAGGTFYHPAAIPSAATTWTSTSSPTTAAGGCACWIPSPGCTGFDSGYNARRICASDRRRALHPGARLGRACGRSQGSEHADPGHQSVLVHHHRAGSVQRQLQRAAGFQAVLESGRQRGAHLGGDHRHALARQHHLHRDQLEHPPERDRLGGQRLHGGQRQRDHHLSATGLSSRTSA